MSTQNIVRDHLFISYAYEDKALADWLVRKLTAEGYRTWCDSLKLLGGESYPRDIDSAIKCGTFRVIALLSRHSIQKPNPLKERTLALNISRERHEDFLIPLNVDGLRATDLDWMTSDLTFIPFNENWATGLSQLLKKLAALDAPRPLTRGAEIAAGTYFQDSAICQTPEILYSNQLQFTKIPEVIRRFKFARPISRDERTAIARMWPAYFVDRVNVLAFRPPKSLSHGLTVTATGGSAWRYETRINGILSKNILVALLNKELVNYCLNKGLLFLGKQEVCFPSNFGDGKLHFVGWDGKKTWLQVVGQRSAWRAGKTRLEYQYHLSLRFSITHHIEEHYRLQIKLGLHITDISGQPLPSRSALARRKAICKSWWNDAWLKRTIAVCEFLSDGKKTIEMGLPGEDIILNSGPLLFQIPIGINEEALEKEEESPQEVDIIDEEEELQLVGESDD